MEREWVLEWEMEWDMQSDVVSGRALGISWEQARDKSSENLWASE